MAHEENIADEDPRKEISGDQIWRIYLLLAGARRPATIGNRHSPSGRSSINANIRVEAHILPLCSGLPSGAHRKLDQNIHA